jgi:membrane protease YdiL (CAAX protease family)
VAHFSDTSRPARDLAILGSLTLPFLLNDFANIYVSDYRSWLTIDYTLVKLLPLVLIGIFLRGRFVSFHDLGLRAVRIGPFLGWTVLMMAAGIVLDSGLGRFLAAILPDTRLGGMPPISDPVVNQLDLHLGLGLVALVEEMIFRGLYFTLLSRYLARTAWVLVVSSAAFGLIHWSLGLSAVLHTTLIGAVFMSCMWRTGSVWPTVLAHFLVNYIAFSGILGAR